MHYYSLKEYLINTYGHQIYKIALSCSNTCPNRDGSVGTGGCIFCSEKGSGDFAQESDVPVNIQIENAKKLVKQKFKGDKYIAYFQSFTSTYNDINKLRKIFIDTVKRDDIEIISIATRPDCLSDEVLTLLSDIRKIKPVWVELGLQTLNENTAKHINRCYENDIYFKAVRDLHSININVITHLILGLPGETKDDMINSARQVGRVSDGVKFTVLHVLKNTKLEKMYENKAYIPLTLEEYSDILTECIKVLDKNTVIHRMTGDGKRSQLIAPLWTLDKKYVLQYIYDKFKSNDIVQGSDAKLQIKA